MAIAVHTRILWQDARQADQADLFPSMGVLLSRFGFGVSDDLEATHADMVMMAADRPQHVSQHCDFQRARQAGVPVVVLLSTLSPQSRVAMLDLGADECLSMPCDWRELAARLHALRRRASRRSEVVVPPRYLGFASWTLDTQQGVLRGTDSVGVKLSQAEYQLLLVFLSRPHQVIAPDHLLVETRQRGLEGFDSSIDLLVTRLRCKLGDDPRRPSLIHTVRGQGYLFTASLRTHLSGLAHSHALAADLHD